MNQSRYVTARRLAELDHGLSGRDRAVLQMLARVRVATGSQMERVVYPDVTRRQVRRQMASLVTRRLVARLPRVVGGVRAGSAGFVYSLDVAGQRLMQADQLRSRRPWHIGLLFLAHSLAVTRLYCELVEAHRAGQLKLVRFVTEPASWRSFPNRAGASTMVKPDAAITVVLGEYEDHWLVEVDRDTETLPTIARKLEVYRQYWQSGVEQARSGLFPKVIWSVPNAHRHAALIDVIGRQPAESWPLFTVALADETVTTIARGAAP